ncbi:adenylyl-sulfate kinase [Paenibacillus frigoriresistens]|uniref:adenylyl-sulfate kinase n=1 Tax=Paenibacillus alginolyticus TaxID=59839 RepID=UPI001565C02A|nr:adenylyl-sulfate kinase [Paenibacillus frigoriresistens]NRF96274.1 adenylyl-sulfate kinase [Paenibacillus frigoriresistens]
MGISSNNLTFHKSTVNKQNRNELNQHKSCVLWFTGLSGSGKSTLANEVEKQLFSRGIRTYILDGDNIRFGLNKNLGFSAEDRKENIRRIGEVSKLFVDAGVLVMTAFISPYQADREIVRNMFLAEEFIEVYVNCSLDICEQRDPKGLYKMARKGEIKEFTGVSAPYEVPISPELNIETGTLPLAESARLIIERLIKKQII